MEFKVVNIEGKETGNKVTLSDAIFGIEPNDHSIYLDVKQHLANRRQGTHKAKERAEIAGSTRKIKNKEYIKLFDKDNGYLESRTAEEKYEFINRVNEKEPTEPNGW